MPETPEDAALLAQSHCPEAVRVLARLMASEDEKVALAAAREMLLRGLGRPEAAEAGRQGDAVVLVCEKNVDAGE